MGIAEKKLSSNERREIALALLPGAKDAAQGRLQALCPFHADTSPSFYYCYREDWYRFPGARTQCGDLYEVYEKWAKANGLKPWSSIKLSKELSSRGLQKYKSSNYYWLDVEIKTEFNADRCVGWESL